MSNLTLTQLNKVELIGVVGNVKVMNVLNNKAARFTLCTQFMHKDKSGCVVVESTWTPVIAFESDKINCIEEIKRGSKVQLVGRLKTNRFIKEDGSTVDSLEVVAKELTILSQDNNQE